MSCALILVLLGIFVADANKSVTDNDYAAVIAVVDNIFLEFTELLWVGVIPG